jgi:hypothetical protein
MNVTQMFMARGLRLPRLGSRPQRGLFGLAGISISYKKAHEGDLGSATANQPPHGEGEEGEAGGQSQ